MRLALALGKTLRQLLDDLGEGEMAFWEAYFSLEPFPEEQADWRAASVRQSVHQLFSKDPVDAGPLRVRWLTREEQEAEARAAEEAEVARFLARG